jgi:MiaB-like tRNA modifying enzyme
MARQPVDLPDVDVPDPPTGDDGDGEVDPAFRSHPLQLDGDPVEREADEDRLPAAVGASPEDAEPRSVYMEQYGCSVTEGEAGAMEAILREEGHELVDDVEEADAAVLVTCTVVDTTERRMVDRIEALDAAGVDLVVSGCMASSQVELVKHTAPDALVLPPQYHHQVADLLVQSEVEFCYAPKVGVPRTVEGPVATIPINEGCSGKCTFCITKIARPGLRSYPVDGIAADVREAVQEGAREIRLTSQDSGAYGLDRDTDLPTLLEHVLEVSGDFRVRVGMMNPFILDRILDGLLKAFESEKLYNFLHIPVQSGSEPVLEDMNRSHAVDDFRRQVQAFRDRFPDGVVSTDVIVGFPGETEEDHQATVDLLEEVRPEKVNITRFSEREGTPAADMDDQIVGWKVKERSRELTDVTQRITGEHMERQVGETRSVLVYEQGKEGTETVKARTDNYRIVVLPEEDADVGERVAAEVTEARHTYLMGEVVDRPER